MKTVTSPAKPRVVTCFVAVALASLAGSAGAGITIDPRYVLGENGPAGALPVIGWPHTGSALDLQEAFTDKDGNAVFFHSYAFESTPTSFGARVSGQRTFYGSTRSTWKTEITNDTDVAQSYQFSFDVEEGDISIFGVGTFFGQLAFDIRRDGATVSSNRTTVDNKGCEEESRGVLSEATECGNDPSDPAQVGGRRLTIDLGSLASGKSFKLEYELIATVSGLTQAVCPSGNTVGFAVSSGRNELTTLGQNACGGAIARSGDPLQKSGPSIPLPSVQSGLGPTTTMPESFNQVSGTPDNSLPDSPISILGFRITQSPASIPEPGTLALAGAALMGLAGLRRRRGSDCVRAGA